MSEIVRGRSRGGYLTIDNYIQDGLLEIGSIDLAGFYGALKRFVDRRESSDGKAMPWTVDLFCSKFKIGKQRFYRLAELLWRTGLLDVEKDFGLIDPERGIMGWRNRYVVHDYPDYEGPLHLARAGSFKYRKAVEGKSVEGAGEKEVELEEEVLQEQGAEILEGEEEIKDAAGETGVFLYRNTPENTFGGISNTEIPATGIPAAGIPAVERHIKNKRSKKQEKYKKQEKDNINTSNHSSIHLSSSSNMCARMRMNRSVDNVDSGDNAMNPSVEDKSSEGWSIKTILKNAGFDGLPVEVEYISKWVGVFSPEMIEYAVNKAVLNGKKSLPYIAGIFEDWLKKGVKTVDQAKKETRYDSILLELSKRRNMRDQGKKIKLSDPQVFLDYLNRGD
ncbi:MAG: DnaD domain protein [Pelotomaculum sp.]|nr:DnaD domain protein [Pelotomaculum sp.]